MYFPSSATFASLSNLKINFIGNQSVIPKNWWMASQSAVVFSGADLFFQFPLPMFRRCSVKKMHARPGSRFNSPHNFEINFFLCQYQIPTTRYLMSSTTSTSLLHSWAFIYIPEHNAYQPTIIDRKSVNSNSYRIGNQIVIILNPYKIEKFRIQCWNFSNFPSSQKYFLDK